MPEGKLVVDVGITEAQVGDYHLCARKVIDYLAGNHARLADLVGPHRLKTQLAQRRFDERREDQVGMQPLLRVLGPIGDTTKQVP